MKIAKLRSIWGMLLLAFLLVVAAACGGGDETPVVEEETSSTTEEEQPAEEAAEEPEAEEMAEEEMAACEELTPVRLQLQWVTQSQFAGYYAALDQGFYEKHCLDVTILEGAVEIVPQQVVAAGDAEFGIAWVPKMLASREQGADLVNIGQVFQRSGTLQVSWADTGISSPEDWAGKRVGTWGFGNEFELFAAMRQAGIEPDNADDVTIVQQPFDMALLLNREVDAAQAMTYNEYAQVLEAVNPETGELYQPEDLLVINYNDVGTAMLQDHIFATEEYLAENEDAATRFLAASFEGWIFCRDNFDECVNAVLDNGPTLGEGHMQWQLNEINDLIWPSPNGIGILDSDLYQQTIDIAVEFAVLENPPDEAAARTDLAEAALAMIDGDTTGEGFVKFNVELTEGGEAPGAITPGEGAMMDEEDEAMADEEDELAVDCAQSDPVRLQLQWVTQSQFAGYYAALAEGFYDDYCLDVTILEGAVEIVPQQVVAAGDAEFGIAWVPKVLASREQGVDLVNIGQIFQRSGTLQVSWADTGISAPEDWAGQRVGTWGFGNEFELFAAMRQAGIDPDNADDVTIVQQPFDMALLLNREVDAAQAMIYNEYAQVLEAVNPETGELYQPEDLIVIDYNDVGTAMLQDHIFAREEFLADSENANIATRFLAASFEGWMFCRDNFDACVNHVLDAGPTLGEGHMRWQLNEINALIWPSPGGIGLLDPDLYEQTVDIAVEFAVLENPPDEAASRTDLAEAALDLVTGDTTGEDYTKLDVEVTPGGE